MKQMLFYLAIVGAALLSVGSAQALRDYGNCCLYACLDFSYRIGDSRDGVNRCLCEEHGKIRERYCRQSDAERYAHGLPVAPMQPHEIFDSEQA